MSVQNKPKTARSYRGQLLDDNYVLSLNLKWAFQGICVIIGLVFGYTKIENRLTKLEEMSTAYEERLEMLEEKHQAEIDQVMKWYEEISINPLTGFKKRKK